MAEDASRPSLLLVGDAVTTIAQSLTAKLNGICSAPNANAKNGKLGAFNHEVDAQTDKALTTINAALLKQFAAAL